MQICPLCTGAAGPEAVEAQTWCKVAGCCVPEAAASSPLGKGPHCNAASFRNAAAVVLCHNRGFRRILGVVSYVALFSILQGAAA